MIKPIELFPGALVKTKKEIIKITAVWNSGIEAENKWGCYNIEKIRPITLTPRITEKLGFKKIRRINNGPYKCYKRGRIEIWFIYGVLDSIWKDTQVILNEPPRRKRYVHYLQRALAEKTKARIDFSKLLK